MSVLSRSLLGFVADQPTLLAACRPAVQNFFVYCLTRSSAEPLAFLDSGPHPLPTGPRNMWCTAPLLHAAGRKIYRRAADDFVALQPAEARRAGLLDKEVKAFDFVPMRAEVVDAQGEHQVELVHADGTSQTARFLVPDPLGATLRVELASNSPSGKVFRIPDPRYRTILASCLQNLLSAL